MNRRHPESPARKMLVIVMALLSLSIVSCATIAGAENPGREPPPDYEMGSMDMMMETGGPFWMRFQTYPECTRFLDDTKDKRRQLHIKRFEWFEAARKSETFGLSFTLEQDIRNLNFDIYHNMPFTCKGLLSGGP